MNEIFITLLEVVVNFLRVLQFFIFLAIIFSWFPTAAKHPVVQFIRRVAEPILKIARRIIPRTGMIDFSPILAFLALSLLEGLAIQVIRWLSI